MASNYLKPIRKVLKMPIFEGNNDGYHKSCLSIFTSQLEVTEYLNWMNWFLFFNFYGPQMDH